MECEGEIFRVAGQDPGLPFNEVVKAALIDTGPITVKGTFTSPPEFMGDKKVRGSAIGATMGFCYAAQVVECSVDEITGKVTAEKVWVAVDVGRAINPLAVEGQIQGAVWMGMGQAMSEETRFDQGRMMHAQHAGLPGADDGGKPGHRGVHRRKHRPERPVRRQGGQRGHARRLPARGDGRGARGHRHPPRRAAADARPHRRVAGRQGTGEGMNMLPDVRVHRPATLDEAVRLKAASEGARFLAGGTDLLVNLRRGLGEPSALIDLTAVADLAAVRWEGEALWVGAGVTLADLARHPDVCGVSGAGRGGAGGGGADPPGGGDLGGNLCQDTRCIFYNQSEWWREANCFCLKKEGDKCQVVAKSDRCYATYHGDIAPVLMVLDAEALLVGPEGVRRVRVGDLYRETGASHLDSGGRRGSGGGGSAAVARLAGGISQGADPRCDRLSAGRYRGGVAAGRGRYRRFADGDHRHQFGAAGGAAGWRRSAAPGTAMPPRYCWRLLRKKASVLRTTIVGASYRRRVLQALARNLVDGLWEDPAWRV